ncbi:Pre-mRNA-splicing factor cwc24 [Sphaceloma murrayae]|uniref:Pre-mRNA-splicing factor CWC24 n=1 Tax=Sphaceloma murrayae TaxID=2082308 RepID=A0A2K1QR40_9PEZI|nr:Pre-mRNA-splicing factor cwc24 [Sphaceloma murrayae]
MTDVAPVLFKKRAGKGAAARKRPATPPPESGSDSDYSSEEENGVRVKRRKVGGVKVSATVHRGPQDLSKSTAFAGDRSATIANTDDATRTSHWQELDQSARGGQSNDASSDGKSGTYKGAANYQSYIQKGPDAQQKSVGPVKAATNIRTITVTDFAPDVCKDYKQTGFCGFGDSCKFLHAREDYKQGWQLDKEWESVTKGKKLEGTVVGGANKNAKSNEEEDEESMLDNIPFACIICREPYKNPVVTKCKHYFCEACALKRHKSKGGKSCAACGTDTGGTFGMAKNLRKLLDKKKEREKRLKEQAREAGEEVSSDDE